MSHGRVLAVPMPSEVDLPLEGLVTQAAGKGLIAGVLTHVGYQIGRLAEGFAAHDAFVWFLACILKNDNNNNEKVIMRQRRINNNNLIIQI